MKFSDPEGAAMVLQGELRLAEQCLERFAQRLAEIRNQEVALPRENVAVILSQVARIRSCARVLDSEMTAEAGRRK